MKKQAYILLFALFLTQILTAQNVGINNSGANPNPSAMLDVSATDKGMLVPRLTTAQRTGIANPATSLLVYDTDLNQFFFFDGQIWVPFVAQSELPNTPLAVGSPSAPIPTGGSNGPIVVQGNYGYLAVGSNIRVFDISNPEAPVLGNNVPVSGTVFSMVIQGNYLYINTFTSFGVLVIMDLSMPASPVIVSSFNYPSHGASPPFAFMIAVQGNYAYIPNNTHNTLDILDISNPAAPAATGFVAISNGIIYATGVVVQGSHAFVKCLNNLVSVNISDPSNPTIVGSVSSPVGAASEGYIELKGNYIYDAHLIFDISDPTSLQQVGVINTTGSVRRLYTSDDYLLAATNSPNLLHVFNISSPQTPVQVGQVPISNSNLAIQGNYCFIANFNNLQVLNLNGGSGVTPTVSIGPDGSPLAGPWSSTGNNAFSFHRIGIGTANPEANFSVLGNATVAGNLEVKQNGNGLTGRIFAEVVDATLVVADNLNVNNNLHVSGTISNSAMPIRQTVSLSNFDVPSNGQTGFEVTVPGAQPGMGVIVTPPYDLRNFHSIGFARVTSPGTVRFVIVSNNPSSQNYSANTWRITVIP